MNKKIKAYFLTFFVALFVTLLVATALELELLFRCENKIYKENQTQIFIETPYRNSRMVEGILKTCKPNTKLCIASGITCPQEFIQTKTIAEWNKAKLPEIDKIPAIFLLYK